MRMRGHVRTAFAELARAVGKPMQVFWKGRKEKREETMSGKDDRSFANPYTNLSQCLPPAAAGKEKASEPPQVSARYSPPM